MKILTNNKKNTTIYYAFIWIIIGLFRLFNALKTYNGYSEHLNIYMFPEEIISKNIIVGITGVVIGLFLMFNPKIIIFELCSFIYYLISFSVIWELYQLIHYSYFNIKYFLLLDYLLIILVILTLNSISEAIIKAKKISLKYLLKFHFKRFIIELISFNLFIYFTSLLLFKIDG
jgi:hypothetical protein